MGIETRICSGFSAGICRLVVRASCPHVLRGDAAATTAATAALRDIKAEPLASQKGNRKEKTTA